MRANKQILDAVQQKARIAYEKNTRFHDISHSLAVYKNAKLIIRGESAAKNVDTLAVLTAAILHDLSSFEDKEKEALDGARRARKLLESIPDFPSEKIATVERLIRSVSTRRDDARFDEVIMDDADNLDALSKMSICRGFMLYGMRGKNLRESIVHFDAFVDKKKRELTTKTAKKLGEQKYTFIKGFLQDVASTYP